MVRAGLRISSHRKTLPPQNGMSWATLQPHHSGPVWKSLWQTCMATMGIKMAVPQKYWNTPITRCYYIILGHTSKEWSTLPEGHLHEGPRPLPALCSSFRKEDLYFSLKTSSLRQSSQDLKPRLLLLPQECSSSLPRGLNENAAQPNTEVFFFSKSCRLVSYCPSLMFTSRRKLELWGTPGHKVGCDPLMPPWGL